MVGVYLLVGKGVFCWFVVGGKDDCGVYGVYCLRGVLLGVLEGFV